MRRPRIVGGLGLLIIAIFVALYNIVGKSLLRGGADNYLDKQAPQVKQMLSKALAYPDVVCIYEGPFPGTYDSQQRVNVFRNRCDRCEDLYQAGLLTKSVVEQENDRGQRVYMTRFDLTEFGRSVYSEVPDAILAERGRRAGDGKYPRFCFGNTVLHKVVEVAPLHVAGSQTYLKIKYIAEVVNPHPFLFDPASRPLQIPVPSPGKAALYPPRDLTVIIFPNGEMDFDDGFRNEKEYSHRPI